MPRISPNVLEIKGTINKCLTHGLSHKRLTRTQLDDSMCYRAFQIERI